MSDTPETEHFACALQMQSMQNQIEELTDMLRNTERGLATMTEQRDRLAEALRRIREGWDGTKAEPDCDCEDCEYLRTIDEALAAVKGGSRE
jgi:hypothetical protein